MGVVKAVQGSVASGPSDLVLPRSFASDGFSTIQEARKRILLPNGHYLKPLMIGTEGDSESGKSEFIMSIPGPGQLLALDRGIDPVFDNQTPPPTRQANWGIKFVQVPLEGTFTGAQGYAEYFKKVLEAYRAALRNKDSIAVGIDCDSDFYELQVLATFGKTKQVWPQTRWGDVYAVKRTLNAEAHDTGKIIIGTNKIKPEYETVIDPATGLPELDPANNNEPKRQKTGKMERQGFRDQNYLWNIQLRHMFQPAGVNSITKKPTPKKWGIRILKCKANADLVGTELWGENCNFATLVQLVYPQVPMEEWGF